MRGMRAIQHRCQFLLLYISSVKEQNITHTKILHRVVHICSTKGDFSWALLPVCMNAGEILPEPQFEKVPSNATSSHRPQDMPFSLLKYPKVGSEQRKSFHA